MFLTQGSALTVSEGDSRSILATMSSKCVPSDLIINSAAVAGYLWESDIPMVDMHLSALQCIGCINH